MRLLVWALLFSVGVSVSFSSNLAFAQPFQFSAGGLLDSRFYRDVNPDFTGLKEIGGLFFGVRQGPWGLSIEGTLEQSRSSSGALTIRTQTMGLRTWGRYIFLEPDHWSPFVTLGAGVFFDRVESNFQNQQDVRQGRRGLVGAGGGVSQLFFDWLLLEGEARILSVQASHSLGGSFALRAGVRF